MSLITFDEMRRALIQGWGELGARTADCWREFNRRHFVGRLEPLPIFFTSTAPYGKRLAHCRGTGGTHIVLTAPAGTGGLAADRNTLLHEMIHQHLFQIGKDSSHAGEPWCQEIMRLHLAITGNPIWAGTSTVVKELQADGTRKSVRINRAHPVTGKRSLAQDKIAGWPRSLGIKLGKL
jgi:hypothetical protein